MVVLKKGGGVSAGWEYPKVFRILAYFIQAHGNCLDPSGQDKHKSVEKVAQKKVLLNLLFVFLPSFFLLFQFLYKILHKQTKNDIDSI